MKLDFSQRGLPFRVRFTQDSRGVAAVEFALILPMMMVLYFAVTEVSQAVRASQKVDQIARTVADLAARKLTGGSAPGQAAILKGDITGMIFAARLLIKPLPNENLRLEIDEIEAFHGNRNPHPPVVKWIVWHNTSQRRQCGLLNAQGETDEFKTMPASLAYTSNVSGYLVAVRVQYDYGAAKLPTLFGKALKVVSWSYAVPRVMPNGSINNPLILSTSNNLNDPPFWTEVCPANL